MYCKTALEEIRMKSENSKMMESCAHLCHECQDECLRTIVHCLSLGGEHASKSHQTMLADCVAICGVSHNLLHRQSPQHVLTCRACAEICNACADDCERVGNGDAAMKRCAEVCRRCAESCDAMAGASR
jgi:hypothetical protein